MKYGVYSNYHAGRYRDDSQICPQGQVTVTLEKEAGILEKLE
jgi:hypothetical protein